MTAICGLWHFDGRPGALDRVCRIQGALGIYGRDRVDFWDGDFIALGSGLTRTVPEDRYDRQPLTAAGGRFVMVADLRLDNRDEFADDLDIPVERRATLADADLVLEGWVRWGPEVTARLVGPFAFAVWDRDRRKLHLMRDPLGIRPLYFHAAPGWFAFATMPKGLLALPEIPMRPNDDKVADFLLLRQRRPESFFAGIDGLDKGQGLEVSANGAVLPRHLWNPLEEPLLELASPGEYAEGLRETLTTAVRAMLRSTKPVASQLSAGRDSTAVTAAAARLLAERGKTLTAFTARPLAGFVPYATQQLLADEGPIADLVAARYGNIRHLSIYPPRGGIIEAIDQCILTSDGPPLNPVNVGWSEEIHRRAQAEGLGVLLTGLGGNYSVSYDGGAYFSELIEDRRWGTLLRALLTRRGASSAARLSEIAMVARWVAGETAWTTLRRLLGRRSDPFSEASSFSTLHPRHYLTADGRARLAQRGTGTTLQRPPFTRAYRWHRLTGGGRGPDDKGTLAAHGLDSRHPLLDIRLVRFCLGVPTGEHYRRGRFGGLYRDAFDDWLPPQVTTPQQKGDQGADWHLHLGASLSGVADLVDRMSDLPEAEEVIDMDTLRALVEGFPVVDDGSRVTRHMYNYKLTRGLSGLSFIRYATGKN